MPKTLPTNYDKLAQKNHRSTRIIIVSALVVVALVVVSIVGWLVQRSTVASNYTQVFNAALENHLAVKYIQQDYTFKRGSLSSTYKMKSDFSDPARPKTIGDLSITSQGEELASKIIATTDYSEYGLLITTPEQMKKMPRNQWIHANSIQEAASYDLMGMGGGVNTTFGEILVGNYTPADRKILLDLYKTHPVYSFTATKDVTALTVEGRKIYRYTVTFDKQACLAVNKEAARLLKISLDKAKPCTADIESAVLDVDTESKHFIKAITKADAIQATLDFSYPAMVSIDIPKKYIEMSDIAKSLQ